MEIDLHQQKKQQRIMADQNSFNFRLGKVNQDVCRIIKYHGSSGPLRIHELVEGHAMPKIIPELSVQ